jgi:hypothetical protein
MATQATFDNDLAKTDELAPTFDSMGKQGCCSPDTHSEDNNTDKAGAVFATRLAAKPASRVQYEPGESSSSRARGISKDSTGGQPRRRSRTVSKPREVNRTAQWLRELFAAPKTTSKSGSPNKLKKKRPSMARDGASSKTGDKASSDATPWSAMASQGDTMQASRDLSTSGSRSERGQPAVDGKDAPVVVSGDSATGVGSVASGSEKLPGVVTNEGVTLGTASSPTSPVDTSAAPDATLRASGESAPATLDQSDSVASRSLGTSEEASAKPAFGWFGSKDDDKKAEEDDSKTKTDDVPADPTDPPQNPDDGSSIPGDVREGFEEAIEKIEQILKVILDYLSKMGQPGLTDRVASQLRAYLETVEKERAKESDGATATTRGLFGNAIPTHVGTSTDGASADHVGAESDRMVPKIQPDVDSPSREAVPGIDMPTGDASSGGWFGTSESKASSRGVGSTRGVGSGPLSPEEGPGGFPGDGEGFPQDDAGSKGRLPGGPMSGGDSADPYEPTGDADEGSGFEDSEDEDLDDEDDDDQITVRLSDCMSPIATEVLRRWMQERLQQAVEEHIETGHLVVDEEGLLSWGSEVEDGEETDDDGDAGNDGHDDEDKGHGART